MDSSKHPVEFWPSTPDFTLIPLALHNSGMSDDEEDAFDEAFTAQRDMGRRIQNNSTPSPHASKPVVKRPSASASAGLNTSSTPNGHGKLQKIPSNSSLSSDTSLTGKTTQLKSMSTKIMSSIDRRRSSIMQRMGFVASPARAGGLLETMVTEENKTGRPYSAPVPRTPASAAAALAARPELTAEERAWEERWTIDELPYYYNNATEAVTWEKPDALKTPEEMEHESGEWTWIPHPTNVWQGARVVKHLPTGEVECKTLMGAKKVIIPANRMVKDASTNGREQHVPMWPLIKSSLYLLSDDLVALDDPNEGLILHNLRARFQENHIYTWVGASRSVLVSLNPYKQVQGMYSKETIQQQREKSPNRPPPPHVFGITSDALDSLLYDARNNAILISGESGAGKTEATKHCLKYLAAVAGSKNHVENRVLEANPMLEAFGNAKTLRNNNSSRFGKWLEVNFDSKTRQISGATITTYLLERSRVVFQSKGERSFHIFYQVATNESFRQQYALSDPPEAYRYLANSGCTTVDGVDDAKELSHVIRSMGEMGFENDEQEWIMRMCCAILHLGQIDFEALDEAKLQQFVETNKVMPPSAVIGMTGSRVAHKKRAAVGRHTVVMPKGKGATVFTTSGGGSTKPSLDARISNLAENSGVTHLKEAARLLCVDDDKLEKALCFRTVRVKTETSIVPLDCDEARVGVDSFVMSLYSRLFEWLVGRINQALGGGGKGHFIGLLDIFGFEIFEKNSFEQLCINFANEKLQTQFNASMFNEEEALYVFEDIEFQKVEFQDNTAVLKLIEGRPDGLLPQLDDEVRAPGGSDERYHSKMTKTHATNARFQIDAKKKLENALSFQIVHYAGVVKYDAAGFVRANVDTLQEDLHLIATHSSDKKLACLFPVGDDMRPASFVPAFVVDSRLGAPPSGGGDRKKSTMVRGRSQSSGGANAPSGAQMERAQRKNTMRFNASTVAARFRDQLSELMDLLEQTESRYIRCIKPNTMQQGDLFDSNLILEQLRYSGVFEAVDIRRRGFPFRWNHKSFVFQFKVVNMLLKEKIKYRSRDDDYAGMAQEILDNMPGKPKPFKDVRIGKTRVLYKAKEHKLLSLLRNLALEKCIPWLQARLRGYIARRMRKIMGECDQVLQYAIDLGNDLDALENAFDECKELIGPNIPNMFPRATPSKQRQADRLADDLQLWIELEADLEDLENDSRDVMEMYFDMKACLTKCQGLAERVPMTRRQERLVSNLKDKVEHCTLQKGEERFVKMLERAKASLGSLDRARMKQTVEEFRQDAEICERHCEPLESIKTVLKQMAELDVEVGKSLKTADALRMKACLETCSKKYPKTHVTEDMKECSRLLALPEWDFIQLELKVAVELKDEARRIHREIRIQEMQLDRDSSKYTPIGRVTLWRKPEDWANKASFFTKLFGKEKLVQSFFVFTSKPVHFSLTTSFGDSPDRKKLAQQLSKAMVGYITEGQPGGKTSLAPDDNAKQVLSIGLSDESTRDEVYLHLIKMLTQNNGSESSQRAEELLGFCVLTFPPSTESEWWVLVWLREKFRKDSEKCKKYMAALHLCKYGVKQRSAKSVGTLRSEWEALTNSRFSLQPGESSGPTPPNQIAMT